MKALHSTRYGLPFSEVAAITPISTPDIDLPRNIVVANGSTPQDRRANALDVLCRDGRVNSVVIIEPPRRHVKAALAQLQDAAEGRRIRIRLQTKKPDGTRTLTTETANAYALMQERLSRYFSQRSLSRIPFGGKEPKNLDPQNLGTASLLWDRSLRRITTTGQTVKQSHITYSPEYGSDQRKVDGFINAHIDLDRVELREKNVRVIECTAGSGTVLFDDDDFEVTPTCLRPIHSGITCWVLQTGSSVIIRTPSVNQTSKPAVHAHGIGSETEDSEQRLTIKHDLCL